MMTGNELTSARKALDLTQEKLAQALGVTNSTVARWEQLRESEIPTSQMLDLSIEALKKRQKLKTKSL